jgi:hypothetical protein
MPGPKRSVGSFWPVAFRRTLSIVWRDAAFGQQRHDSHQTRDIHNARGTIEILWLEREGNVVSIHVQLDDWVGRAQVCLDLLIEIFAGPIGRQLRQARQPMWVAIRCRFDPTVESTRQ